MVVKNTQAVAKATAPRLPPLHKLRVRKPDQAGANPCIGVMSSVLGMLGRNPLLSVSCCSRSNTLPQDAGLRLDTQLKDVPLLSNSCAHAWTLPYVFAAPIRPTTTLTLTLLQKAGQTKKSSINYHLSRLYPQIIGPHKRK